MLEEEDKKIVEEVLKGKVNAFGTLVDRYQQSIYRMTLRMIGDSEEAQELTQNVFVKVYSKLDSFDPKYKFFSWLYRIALNESLNYVKSRKKLTDFDENSFEDHETPEEIYQDKEKKRILHRSLLELSEKYRIVIVMKYYDNMSYEEISEVTGLSVKKVRSRLFTARKNLKELIEKKQ